MKLRDRDGTDISIGDTCRLPKGKDKYEVVSVDITHREVKLTLKGVPQGVIIVVHPKCLIIENGTGDSVMQDLNKDVVTRLLELHEVTSKGWLKYPQTINYGFGVSSVSKKDKSVTLGGDLKPTDITLRVSRRMKNDFKDTVRTFYLVDERGNSKTLEELHCWLQHNYICEVEDYYLVAGILKQFEKQLQDNVERLRREEHEFNMIFSYSGNTLIG